jgi:Tfp pilus assembly protein FimT
VRLRVRRTDAPRPARSNCARAGFSLVEILLTLVLLVAMASLLWPALEKPFAAQRLRKSGDQLRAAWTSARVQAMSTGLVQAFRYQPGSGEYSVAVWECQETDSGDGAAAEAPADFSALPYVAGPAAQTPVGKLPDRIQFLADEIAEDARAQHLQGGGSVTVLNNTSSIRPANGAGGDGDGAAGANGQPLSTPILFYPDGTTSTARVLLENEHGRKLIVELRGLTGVATLVEE